MTSPAQYCSKRPAQKSKSVDLLHDGKTEIASKFRTHPDADSFADPWKATPSSCASRSTPTFRWKYGSSPPPTSGRPSRIDRDRDPHDEPPLAREPGEHREALLRDLVLGHELRGEPLGKPIRDLRRCR